jgi:cell volume regulation protein A
MFLVDTLILIAGVLLLLGIASSKFSARVGVPVLVLFLAVGMLAGSEGIGRIDFEDYRLAHAIGTLALAVILFDGGLRTSLESIRFAWRPALVLATAGVLITALATGAAAAWMLNVSLLEGLLLGSIVGSTDAAAVFATLRYGGVQLSKRLSSTLEVESGANDPMAIFMTVGCIQVLSGEMDFGLGLFQLLLTQMVVGAVVGLAAGKLAVWIINRINLDAAGLYPVLAMAFALLTFGVTAAANGSGFLAVYLAGIVIGNSRLVFQRGILLFHDAAAWFAQIVMFVVLGLLSFPSRLLDVAGEGFMVAAVLIFVARPATVALTLLPFGFSMRELTFISWVGLKGAVPITLATFPLMFNIAGAPEIFDIVFFVVVVSALVQGWSMPPVARWLGVDEPLAPTPPVTLELSSLRHVDGDIVDYTAPPESRAAGRLVRELALPEGVVIALVTRGQQIIPPHGNTRIEAGDHVVVVLRNDARPLVNNIFSRGAMGQEELPAETEFPLRANVTVGELEAFYGIRMDAPAEITLGEFLRQRLHGESLQPGASVVCGEIALLVRGINEAGTVERVGMVILPAQQTLTAEKEQDATK